MAKLIVIAFTIATLLAFASAHRTIITTTIEDDTFDINPSSKKEQCRQHLQGQQFRQCQTYLQQPEQTLLRQPHPQQQKTLKKCCQELRNIDEECVCKAVKQMFRDVQQQQQQQEDGPFGSQQIHQLKQKAENLPDLCNVQTRKQCNIKTGKQCQKQVQGRQLNRCQKFLKQETGSGSLRTAVMKQKQMDELEECCEELRNVDMECQCEAMKEVLSQTQEAEQRPEEMRELRRMVQNLKNQCDLEVEQCHIPSEVF
ncbi:2S seed storage protein-like [Cynara cardunculus var. scolymus]|uniref:2S seed storage protein-like n=1 Tax=Cynara cardunculus var. scolymus TaxID=59895 RepID=UPI000D628562|nr:2S seed storage protein-like [Cynara cardunculus var. scolymus]